MTLSKTTLSIKGLYGTLSIIILSIPVFSVVFFNDMLSVVMLSVVMVSVFMFSVVMVSVVAPFVDVCVATSARRNFVQCL